MSARIVLAGHVFRQPDGRYTWEYSDWSSGHMLTHTSEDSLYSPAEALRDMAKYNDKREAERYYENI